MNFVIPLIIVVEIIGGIVFGSPIEKQPQNKPTASYKNILGEEDNSIPTPESQSQVDTPTSVLPTSVPPTSVPPTSIPPTSVPPTSVPNNVPSENAATPPPEEKQTVTNPKPTNTLEPTSEPTQAQESSPTQPTSPSTIPEKNQENPSPTTSETPKNQEDLSPTSEPSLQGKSNDQELSQQSPSPIQVELQSETDNQKTSLNDLHEVLKDHESQLFNNTSNKSASDSLSKENKDEMEGENNQVNQAVTPLEKAHLLVEFGDKDVQHMNSDAKDNNLDNVAFHAEKFSDQLGKAIDTMQKLPPDQVEQVKQDVTSLCKNADTTLRQQELLMAENDSQAIETARGKCLDYTYGQ